MIIPDTNLLLYAYNDDSPDHSLALTWWQNCLSGSEPVGLPLVVVFGFIRIATNPRIFQAPMTAKKATGHVRSWLSQPGVEVINPDPDHALRVLDLLEQIGVAGNLVTDVQVAALAIENDAIVHTVDSDFARFDGIKWHNPITGKSSGIFRKNTR